MTGRHTADRDRVVRVTPLPEGEGRGRLIVTQAVARETNHRLQQFSGADGRHEGLVLWLGRRIDQDTVIAAIAVPEASHTWGSVRVEHRSVGLVSRAARRSGLSLLVQVHSHPGHDNRHSDGDDGMVLLPFEGAFSLVVGRYGSEPIEPRADLGLHQFQDGRWVLVRPITAAFLVVPTVVG
jgi:Prokaryotic homologs of the JAB domain